MWMFVLGFMLGALLMYTLIEFLIFKVAQGFHIGCRDELTFKKYFLGRD